MKEYDIKKHYTRTPSNYHSNLVVLDNKFKSLVAGGKTNKQIFEQGYNWFNDGFSLDDAREELRINPDFVKGYEKAIRVKGINDSLEALGTEWYESGLSLESAPKNYVSNPYFISGYESAMKKDNNKHL